MIKFIPNILTVARLGLTVVYLFMLLYSPKSGNPTRLLDWAFVIFVIAGLTDIIDGWMARKFNVTSKFGRIVDPLADKVLVCGSFICFAVISEPRLFDLPVKTLRIIHWSVAGILIAREVYVTVIRQLAESKGFNFAATTSGKIKMFLQIFAIGTVIIKMGHVQSAYWGYWFTSVVFAAMVLATIISGIKATQRIPF